MLSAGRGLAFFVTIACVVVAAISQPSSSSTTTADPVANADAVPSTITPPLSRDLEDAAAVEDSSDLSTVSTVDALFDFSAKDMMSPIAVANRGHKKKPMKHKKKKPMGKHKKKKQTFKDKLMPLLLIPFVIQTMLIPMFIMNLKMFALKAMAIGKIAILLIVFNMIRSWSQNSHSTSISGSTNGVMAQNYGFNGGPEIGALFNGR